MTVRQAILANIKAILSGVSALQGVEVGKYDPVDLAETTFPTAFLFADWDLYEEAERTTAHEVFNWNIVIELWCKAADGETLFGLIEAALGADLTLGNTALDCRRLRSDTFSLDPVRGILSIQLTYKIKYRHPYGQP